MSEKWSWTDRDDKRLREIGRETTDQYTWVPSQSDMLWLYTKLRIVLQEMNHLEFELSDERTGAKHVATEAIRRTKEAVKDAILEAVQEDNNLKVGNYWPCQVIMEAIDETEVK